MSVADCQSRIVVPGALALGLWAAIASGCGAARGRGDEGPHAASAGVAADAADGDAEGGAPALTSRQRVESVLAQQEGDDKALDALRAIPESALALVDVAAEESHPLSLRALGMLGHLQSAEGAVVLSSIADRPVAHDAPASQVDRLRVAIVALCRYDTTQTAFVLARLRSDIAAHPEWLDHHGFREAQQAIDGYLWRMGLTGDLGICAGSGTVSFGPSRGALGTAHPSWVRAADAGRRWAVLLQAREDTDGDGTIGFVRNDSGALEGDRAALYLVIGSGPGGLIDEYIAQDANGRFLVVRRGMCLTLVDAVSHREMDLGGADARDDSEPNAVDVTAANAHGYHARRGVAFSPDGQKLLYLRPKSGTPRIVVRDLTTGAEASLDPGNSTVLDASPSTPIPQPLKPAIVGVRGEDAWSGPVRGPLRWKR